MAISTEERSEMDETILTPEDAREGGVVTHFTGPVHDHGLFWERPPYTGRTYFYLSDAELAAFPSVDEAVKVLTFAVGRPRRAREIMEREGLIVHDLDDPWQKLVLTLYSELVTTTEAARRALAGLGLEEIAAVPGNTDYAGYSEAELSWQGEDDAEDCVQEREVPGQDVGPDREDRGDC